MTKRAVLYGRVSSNDKAKTDGANLKAQLSICREYAKKQGYTIIAELAENDRGASGATFDLPQLSIALEMAGRGSFDVLIARELDRLSRDLAKQLIIEQELKRSGVVIEYALYDFPDTPEGRLNKNMRAMLAEYEREKIKQRMARGRQRIVERGEVMTHGVVLFGYREVKDGKRRTLEIVEDEARIVRLIFEWYTVGNGDGRGPLAMRQIALELTRLGVLSPTDQRSDCGVGGVARSANPPGHWDPAGVSRILTTETYAGVWHYGKRGKNPIAVSVPAIIDAATWENVIVRRATNKPFCTQSSKYPFLLDKRLRCGNCGHKLRAMTKDGGRYLYYKCHARYTNNNDCDQTKYIPAAIVDAIAWEWITELCTNPQELLATIEAQQEQREVLIAPLRNRLEIVNQLLADNTQKRERLIDLYLVGGFERDMLTERKVRLEKEAAGLEAERARLAEQIREQTIGQEAIDDLMQMAKLVRGGLEVAQGDLDKQRRIVEDLNLTGVIFRQDGEYHLRLDIEWLGKSMVTVVTGNQSVTITQNRLTSFRSIRTMSVRKMLYQKGIMVPGPTELPKSPMP